MNDNPPATGQQQGYSSIGVPHLSAERIVSSYRVDVPCNAEVSTTITLDPSYVLRLAGSEGNGYA